MASNKIFRAGPMALTTALTTDLLNPPAASGGVNGGSSGMYIVVRHIRVVNRTAGAVTCSLWLGASGGNVAGTESVWQGQSVQANGTVDWYGQMRIDVGDFLVGGASANNALSLQIEGEIGVA